MMFGTVFLGKNGHQSLRPAVHPQEFAGGRELSRPGNEAKTEVGALPIELRELPLATGLEPATSSVTGKYLFSTPPACFWAMRPYYCQGTCEASFRACAVRDLVLRGDAPVPRDHCSGRVSRPACRLAVEVTRFYRHWPFRKLRSDTVSHLRVVAHVVREQSSMEW